MKRKRPTAAQQREQRFYADACAERSFFEAIERVTSVEEAIALAEKPMSQLDPGYRFHQRLAYFLRCGHPPDGAVAREIAAYDALRARLAALASSKKATAP